MGSLSNNDSDGYGSPLKSEFALLQTLPRSFHLVYFVKCWQMFLELNSGGEFRHFHVVVVQRREKKLYKKSVVHV